MQDQEQCKFAKHKYDPERHQFIKNILHNLIQTTIREPNQQLTHLLNQKQVSEMLASKQTDHSKFINSFLRNNSKEFLQPNLSKDPALQIIHHLKVHQQNIQDVCGFYALHNAILLTEAFFTQNKQECMDKLVHTKSFPIFWKFHKKTVDYLVIKHGDKIAKKDLVSLRNLGPVQRYQMKLLTQNHRRIEAITKFSQKHNIYFNILRMDFAFNRFQFGVKTIMEIDNVCNEFLLQKRKAILIFFIGVTNHWLTFIATKSKQMEVPSFYLLDSRNAPYLSVNTQKELEDLFQSRLQQSVKFGKQYPMPWKRDIWIQSYRDSQIVTRHLVNALQGQIMLPSVYQTQQFQNFLRQFNQYCEFVGFPTPRDVFKTIKSSSKLQDYMHSVLSWMHDNFSTYLLWKDVYKTLEDFENYLPDPKISMEMMEFLEMIDKLVKEKKSALSASEKKAAQDLVYLTKKFQEKL